MKSVLAVIGAVVDIAIAAAAVWVCERKCVK